MKRTFLLAILTLLACASARAQVTYPQNIQSGTTKPASCSNTNVAFHLTQIDGSNPVGFYRCNGSTYVYVGFTGGTVSSPINLPNGSTTTPSLTGATTNAGFSFNTTSVRYSSGGSDNGSLISDSIAVGSGGGFTFSSTTSPAGASDLKLVRDSAGVLRLDTAGSGDASMKARSLLLTGATSGSATLSATATGSNLATENMLVVGCGGTSPPTFLTVCDSASTTPRGLMSWQASNDTSSAHLHMRKSRGTFATPLTIVSGDILGRVVFSGYEGTNYNESAYIRATSAGTIAATRVPSKLEFWTSTDALPSVATLALTLDKDQSATFANTVNATTFVGALTGTASGNLTSASGLNATNLTSGTVAAARGGAGTITGALKGNGAGLVTQAASTDLSDGTTVGRNLFNLTNPSAISFPKIAADNSVSTRTPAQVATDIGAELTANKDAASGYAGLDGSTLLKAAEFPAFTGDATKAAGSLVTVVAKVNGNTPGGTCTNQFVRSLNTSAVPTCATVGTNDIAPSIALTTPNIGAAAATSISFGGGTACANYQEGTFTPVLKFNNGVTGITYTTQQGVYTRTCDKVFVEVDIVLSSKGSSTGSATITGLPVAAASTAGQIPAQPFYFATATYTGVPHVFIDPASSTTAFQIYIVNNGTPTAAADTNFSNTSVVHFTFTYRTN
jgi:hypothetical protein